MSQLTVPQAKNRLRELRKQSPLLTLSPEICDLVVTSGGPTFRQTGKGFRCVQTGELVRASSTEAFRSRVSSGQSRQGQAVNVATAIVTTGKTPLSVYARGLPGYMRCPFCTGSQYIDYKGQVRCKHCRKEFQVLAMKPEMIEKLPTAPPPAELLLTATLSTDYTVRCPYCRETNWYVYHRGARGCGYCYRRFEVI